MYLMRRRAKEDRPKVRLHAHYIRFVRPISYLGARYFRTIVTKLHSWWENEYVALSLTKHYIIIHYETELQSEAFAFRNVGIRQIPGRRRVTSRQLQQRKKSSKIKSSSEKIYCNFSKKYPKTTMPNTASQWEQTGRSCAHPMPRYKPDYATESDFRDIVSFGTDFKFYHIKSLFTWR